MSEAISRLNQKIQRKLDYLGKLTKDSPDHDLLKQIPKIRRELVTCQQEKRADMKQFILQCKNYQLKFIKKTLENIIFNKLNNVEAFKAKSLLKEIPFIKLVPEVFGSRWKGTPTNKFKQEFNKKWDVRDIDLPIFYIPLQDLSDSCKPLLLSIRTSFLVDQHKLSHLVDQCLIIYNHVAYHNFSHGFSVMQVFNKLASTTRLKKLFTGDDLFLSLIACLSHDLGHRKFN